LEIVLQLDRDLKSTLEEIFHLSVQLPALGFQASGLSEDGHAIFRLAKEYSLSHASNESKTVDAEDVVRMLRFVCWLLFYLSETAPPVNSPLPTHALREENLVDPTCASTTQLNATAEGSLERTRKLRHFFANMVLQAQAQNSGFESLLRSFGVDRQLDPRLAQSYAQRQKPRSAPGTPGTTTALNLNHTQRTQLVRIQLTSQGAELSSATTEDIWTAAGWKQS
jgi:NADH:ubiquinone oxidoreductase subunit C